jgi:hypothetical protein
MSRGSAGVRVTTTQLKCPARGLDNVWSTNHAWLGNPTPSLPELPWLIINNRAAEERLIPRCGLQDFMSPSSLQRDALAFCHRQFPLTDEIEVSVMRHSLRSRPDHAKTNREAAIETHATSMKRAWPASKARMAPTAAINRAIPVTTRATQLRVILIRISL